MSGSYEREAALADSPPPRAANGEVAARVAASGVFLAAAAFTLYSSRSMSSGMSMPGGWTMPMMWMVMPDGNLAAAAAMFLAMWQAMMVAMMLPSTWPMLSLYRRVAEYHHQSHTWLKTALVGAGYFAVWLGFGAVAFGLGYLISAWAMHSEKVSKLVPLGAGAALICAGIYQLTPLKQACLRHCREPVLYLSHIWRPGAVGALRVGLLHGAFCAACCWALMLIQMILGVMNLAVMVAIAAIIGVEKLWKRGPALARFVGAASIVAGLAILLISLGNFHR